MKILHSFPENESKFLTHFYALFQIEGFENTVVKSLESEYLKGKFDLVIVHNLRPRDAKFIAQGAIQEKIIWFSWGTDIYKLPKIVEPTILPLTNKRYINQLGYNVKRIAKTIFKEKVKSITKYTTYRYYHRAILKIDTMIPVIKSEYLLIKKLYNKNIKYFDLNYPVIDEKVKNNFDKKIFAIVGNSASIWNNHFDLFEVLKNNRDMRQGKILLPLSYGANKRWIALIKTEANKLFGDSLVYIDELMAKAEYDNLIRQAEVMIMYHIRQSAVGNILMALDNNVHVYLHNENPTYEYLIDKGFILSTVSQNTKFMPLNRTEYEHNRFLVREIYGLEALHIKLHNLMEVLSV